MGAVKRVVCNEQLLNATDYTQVGCLKNLLSNMEGLIKLLESGDQVAGAILIDLKTVLGMYSMKDCKLNKKQRYAIIYNLVHGIPQDEVAEMMGTSQRMINYYIKTGLVTLSKQLTAVR